MVDLDRYASEAYCYLTTIGRVSGKSHRIEIWFALQDGTIYLLAGGGTNSDWVKNFLKQPDVTVELGGQHYAGRARLISDEEEDALARELVVDKYQPGYNEDLSEWRRTATTVAIDC